MHVDADIRRAQTIPSALYTNPAVLDRCREAVFARSWQMVADTDVVRTPRQVYPFFFLEGLLDEPLLLTRGDDDRLHCLSNVCTHRGNLVIEQPATAPGLRCRYHGRRFALDGAFESMPEFEQVEGHPAECDNLSSIPFETWGRFLFVSLDPAFAFAELIEDVNRRLGWLPFAEFTFDPSRSRDYSVAANWALYCDNYLEGFHIPFVHSGLNTELDYGAYRTELGRWASALTRFIHW